MEPLPLPSHIHYELLLQMLERQTTPIVDRNSAIHPQVQQLIITLRKALSQQKQLEEKCQRHKIPVEYRWSLNTPNPHEPQPQSKDFLSLGQD